MDDKKVALQKKKEELEKRKRERERTRISQQNPEQQQQISSSQPQTQTSTGLGLSSHNQDEFSGNLLDNYYKKWQEDSQNKKKENLKSENQIGEIQIGFEQKDTISIGTQCLIIENSKQNGEQDDQEQGEAVIPPKHQMENRNRTESTNFNNSQILNTAEKNQGGSEQLKRKNSLSKEDLDQIQKSSEFSAFFDRCSKLVEKALNNEEVQHLENQFEEMIDDEQIDKNDPLHLETKFYDQQFCENRVITNLQWSPNFTDVFLASYSQNEEGTINDPVGVVLVWSAGLKSRPEFHCICQSQITQASFYPYNNNLIIGGCYNGQIVIWDVREKNMPVQRSSQEGHAYPIYSLNIVGTSNAHNIVSISNDGTLCTWDMNMLNQPQRKENMKYKNAKDGSVHEVNITCLNFKEDEANSFLVGNENGNLYSGLLHSNNEQVLNNCYQGHNAPITAISQGSIQDNSPYLSNLVLTSSFDWSIKLWNPSVSQQSLYTFENNEDYIYDIQWNKQNPSMFATATGDGYIDIWDLQHDMELPVGRHLSPNQQAFNKLAWRQNGDKLLAGDIKGSINLYGIQKKFLKVDTSKYQEIENVLKSNVDSI
ncbi:WD40-repeat-containing domain [Pseudocohnilembus persalinus]|uniref:WD40-repeat-containing domain n=1 Tax=Pseudocohnilembus persalinus TaxID=266149 RepID=A0A0V0QIM9_PSEPJ|nr:WD40-repeat-containing domain [Pseudocohnilembus persalinus]|eukprot:KRX01996.1 WD40-repeat-containing domain [Pseudocohnilembus persalinus]